MAVRCYKSFPFLLPRAIFHPCKGPQIYTDGAMSKHNSVSKLSRSMSCVNIVKTVQIVHLRFMFHAGLPAQPHLMITCAVVTTKTALEIASCSAGRALPGSQGHRPPPSEHAGLRPACQQHEGAPVTSVPRSADARGQMRLTAAHQPLARCNKLKSQAAG